VSGGGGVGVHTGGEKKSKSSEELKKKKGEKGPLRYRERYSKRGGTH